MLDAAVLAAPVLDHQGLDLSAARRLRYVLEQSFRYEYETPVEALRQRLVIVPPPRHGDQHLRAHRLEVTGARVRRRVSRDAAGNVVARLAADQVRHVIEFRLAAVLDRIRDDGPVMLAAQALHQPRMLRPTALTAADERLRDMAAGLGPGAGAGLGGGPGGGRAAGAAGDLVQAAERICAAVFGTLSYQYGVTTVRTTAAEALAAGSGVCQDFAHVMLALCHLVQLPARYVSGHLLGQGGTHAWVEVLVPRAGAAEAVGFDPCHGRRTDGRYVTVATGRDYADVAPVSGSYVGTSCGRLTTSRRVGLLAAA